MKLTDKRAPVACLIPLLSYTALPLTAAPPPRAPDPSTASYRLPFEEGLTYVCTQSRNGGTSHWGTALYAYDFSMPEGARVCAIREGKVAAVKSDGDAGGPSPAFNVHMNYIHIDHGDGTLARYMHLKKDGAFVKLGDTVLQGDVIGLSGNTGFSTGPHLHVDVWRGGTTVPFAFEDVEAEGGVPRTGQGCLSKNSPGLSAAQRRELEEVFRMAELFYEFGAYHYAYPLYRRLSAQKLRVEFKPLAAAQERLEGMEERAEALAREARAAPAEAGTAALERLALARAAFNGVPGAQKINQAHAELSKREGAAAALPEIEKRIEAQELLFQGLRSEADGRPDAALRRYRRLLDAHPGTPFAARAKPRLAELEKRTGGTATGGTGGRPP
jgi:murein DD-endopeptidase MepM/ murein hydrolase activator NlpD